MKRQRVKCPYCGALAALRPAAVVHGESATAEYLYICDRYPACDAYVGVHKKTLKPLGTLANQALRARRMQAHRSFNTLWTSGLMQKWQAYEWMRSRFGLSTQQAHIGRFSEYMCNALIRECEAMLANNRRAA